MRPAAEAEVGGLYMNAQELSPMRTTLEELNHPQPPTPLRTDNSTAALLHIPGEFPGTGSSHNFGGNPFPKLFL